MSEEVAERAESPSGLLQPSKFNIYICRLLCSFVATPTDCTSRGQRFTRAAEHEQRAQGGSRPFGSTGTQDLERYTANGRAGHQQRLLWSLVSVWKIR